MDYLDHTDRALGLAIRACVLILALFVGYLAWIMPTSPGSFGAYFWAYLGDIVKVMVAAGGAWLLVALRGLAQAAVTAINTHTQLRVDDCTRSFLDDLCHTAIAYAINQANLAIDGAVPSAKNHDALIRTAVDYVTQHGPDALAYFGLNVVGVEKMVLARLDTPRPTA